MADAHLLQESPGQPAVRVPLRGEVLIGRGSDCTVTLQDEMVSRHHAKVVLAEGRALVRDLGSTNGTAVGGVRITARTLASGQSFTVGKSTFTFLGADPARDPGSTAPTAELSPEAAEADARRPGLVVTDSSEESVFETRSDLSMGSDAVRNVTQALSFEQMAGLSRRLAALNKIGTALASILEVETLLEEVIQQVFGLFPRADRCCILLEEDGELRPVKVKQRGEAKAGELDIRLSRTVLGLNREERKAVLSFDTTTDQRLSAAASIVASGIRSIMSVPIVQKDEFYGILYLDTADLGSPFSGDDLELLANLASQVAIFVKNARLVGQIERETELRTNLGRYLSPSVVKEIARGNLVPSLGGDLREGTCLFSDIVGFTRICRNLPAPEVVSLLNLFFRELVDAVFLWEGTVDKFGGDAMLCVWGAPVSMVDHASPAVAAALEMQNRLFGFNLKLDSSGTRVRIRMGIGLNSGSFIAGNVGSERRLEYTVIGDAVNLAQRVEEKATGGMVLVSHATREMAPLSAGTRLQPTVIRGAIGEVVVHSIRGIRRPKDPEGTLLTSVPALAGKAGGAVETEAILVGLERRSMGPVFAVRVPREAGLEEAGALEIRPLLPEIPEVPALSGGILGVRKGKGDELPPWVDLEVLVPALPEPLDAILKAGSAWESPLSPEAIPRA